MLWLFFVNLKIYNMPTRTLTLSNMITYCNYFDTATFPYYNELREAFHILNITGCRVSEIFEIWRWTHVSGYEYQLQPQKGNNARSIVLDSLCSNFIDAIANQYSPFLGRTVNQFEYLYNRLRNFGSIVTGDKPVSLYLFRYKYIKNLQSDGLSLAQIASTMGYTSSDTPTAYLNAVLVESFIEPPLPLVIVGNYQIWSGVFNADDGGGGIYSMNDDPINDLQFGKLYTAAAANRILSLFPGFRLPSLAELVSICSFFGSSPAAKLAGFYDTWSSGYLRNSADFGFSGIGISGTGYRHNAGFYFYSFVNASVWSATPYSATSTYTLGVAYNSLTYATGPYYNLNACSLRIIRDVP